MVMSDKLMTVPESSRLATTGVQLTDTVVFVPGMVRIRPVSSFPPAITEEKMGNR